jgi:aconitate hydratase
MGVNAVIAQSFERIHRSNLVGMGVLPLQFKEGDSAAKLELDGTETFDLVGLEGTDVRPMQNVKLRIHPINGGPKETDLTLRIDTPIELEYYKGGGILQYVLRQLLAARSASGD